MSTTKEGIFNFVKSCLPSLCMSTVNGSLLSNESKVGIGLQTLQERCAKINRELDDIDQKCRDLNKKRYTRTKDGKQLENQSIRTEIENLLKQKRQKQKVYNDLLNQMSNISHIQQSTEALKTAKQTVDILAVAKGELEKELASTGGVDSVQEVVEKVSDSMYDANLISQSVSQTLVIPTRSRLDNIASDEELDIEAYLNSELDKLDNQVDMTPPLQPQFPPVPSTPLPIPSSSSSSIYQFHNEDPFGNHFNEDVSLSPLPTSSSNQFILDQKKQWRLPKRSIEPAT